MEEKKKQQPLNLVHPRLQNSMMMMMLMMKQYIDLMWRLYKMIEEKAKRAGRDGREITSLIKCKCCPLAARF